MALDTNKTIGTGITAANVSANAGVDIAKGARANAGVGKGAGVDQKRVHFISLGCPKNLVDSEIMLGHLAKNAYTVTDDAADADTIIVNTCGFIEASKQESIQTILDAAKMKENGKLKNLVVAGCLTQRYKDELVEGLPEADLFIGSGEFHRISEILEGRAQGSPDKKFFNLPTYLQEDSTPRINSQPKHRAYLKISEGCLKRCAFCAIPIIRGNLQSRKLQGVLSEAKLLVAGGVKELIVISHDFTDYGWDLRRKDQAATESPFELLKTLSDSSGAKWIRLLYLYPDGISPEMIQLIKTRDNLVKYFDMPLQHVNNEMLKSMNRKMTREEISEVLINIRAEIPNAVIRTQFIVGFPGETEAQFQELLQFVEEQQFDRVGCFMYSPEEKTAGFKMANQIEEDVKQDRHDRLMALQQEISHRKHQAMIGREMIVLVEGFSEETELLLQGRNSQQAPEIDGVTLITSGEAQIGELVRVRVTDAMEYDLIAEIIEDEASVAEAESILN